VLTLLAPANGSVTFNVSGGTFTNNNSFTVAAASSVSATPVVYANQFVNGVAGTFNVNTSTTVSGSLTNFGTINISSGTLQLASAGNVFNQSGGTVTLGAGTNFFLPNTGQFNINGGTINLSAGSTPGTFGIVSLLWPNPPIPANPATDLAYINTTAVSAGQSPGLIRLYGGERTFDIADPNATLTITADILNGSVDKSGPGTLIFNGAEGFTGVLQDLAGTLTIGANASLSVNSISVFSGATLNVIGSLGSIPINNNGTVNFPATAAGFHVVSLAGLSLTTGQVSTVAAPASHANRTFLELGLLAFTGTTNSWQGQLDLTSNDLDVENGSLANITNQVKTGFNGGAWNGQGIISSTAAADTTHLTTLGVIVNNDGSGHALYGTGTTLGTFDGQSPGLNDVLAKFTYYGDANLDGAVDGSDYTKIDAGFNADKIVPGLLTGWYSGDFNYDSKIDGSDYTLIDNAFNSQGATLGSNPLALVATETAQIAGASSAVPEPGSLGIIGLSIAGLLPRRRRRSETSADRQRPNAKSQIPIKTQ
jgi:hypothetical protein